MKKRARASGGFLKKIVVEFPKPGFKEGGAFCLDRNCLEFNTPLIELEQGGATHLADAMIHQRAMAYSVAPDGDSLKVKSTHYNVSSEIQNQVEVLAACALAPALACILPGFSRCRPFKNKRAEFVASRGVLDYDQLRAGILFLIGCSRGMERLIQEKGVHQAYQDLPVKLLSQEIAIPGGGSHYEVIAGILFKRYEMRSENDIRFLMDVGKRILSTGPSATIPTNLGEKRAFDLFKTYFDYFKEDIRSLATDEEWKLLCEFVEEKRKLESLSPPISSEYFTEKLGKGHEEVLRNYKATGIAEIFEDAAIFPEKKYVIPGHGILTRITESIGWDGIMYGLTQERNGRIDRGDTVRVFVPQLAEMRLSPEPAFFLQILKQAKARC